MEKQRSVIGPNYGKTTHTELKAGSVGSNALIANWLWFPVRAMPWRMAIKFPVKVSFPFLSLFLPCADAGGFRLKLMIS